LIDPLAPGPPLRETEPFLDSARIHGIDAPPGSLLVADECHRYASPESKRALIGEYEQRLGLTATLERPDRAEHELINYFGPVCYRIGYHRALVDAVVAQFSLTLIGVLMAEHEAIRYESISRRISDLFKELTTAYGFPTTPFHRFIRAVKEAAEEGSWSPAQSAARAFQGAVFERKDLMVMANSDSKFATVALDDCGAQVAEI
jgi:RNA polymerase primary sigma factor